MEPPVLHIQEQSFGSGQDYCSGACFGTLHSTESRCFCSTVDAPCACGQGRNPRSCSVREVMPTPVDANTAPAQVVHAAPARVIEHLAPGPVDEHIVPAQVVHAAPARVIEHLAPGPVDEHIVPAQAVYAALARVIEHVAPSRVEEHTVPAHVYTIGADFRNFITPVVEIEEVRRRIKLKREAEAALAERAAEELLKEEKAAYKPNKKTKQGNHKE